VDKPKFGGPGTLAPRHAAPPRVRACARPFCVSRARAEATRRDLRWARVAPRAFKASGRLGWMRGDVEGCRALCARTHAIVHTVSSRCCARAPHLRSLTLRRVPPPSPPPLARFPAIPFACLRPPHPATDRPSHLPARAVHLTACRPALAVAVCPTAADPSMALPPWTTRPYAST
jgi:hypothetical protein